MGESKTPSPFVKACDRFKTLDILMRSVEEIPKKGRNVGKSYYKRENNNIAEQSTEKEKNEADISPITDLREIKTAIFFAVKRKFRRERLDVFRGAWKHGLKALSGF